MDYTKIDELLEKYFEALTDLEEEAHLKAYFKSDKIAPRHQKYKALFDFYSQEQFVTNPRPVRYEIRKPKKNYWFAGAAVLILGLGLFGLINKKNIMNMAENNPNKKEKVIQEMKVYTNHLNEGIKNVSALSIFGQKIQKVFKVKKDSIQTKNKNNNRKK